MIASGVKISGRPLDEAVSDMLASVERAVEDVARNLPEHLTEMLESGRAPDGGPQPDLAPSTIETKRRAGQPLTPGVATGVLSDPSRWVVRKDDSDWIIEPPPEREDVIEYLEARGYEILGVPSETLAALDDAIRRALHGRG